MNPRLHRQLLLMVSRLPTWLVGYRPAAIGLFDAQFAANVYEHQVGVGKNFPCGVPNSPSLSAGHTPGTGDVQGRNCSELYEGAPPQVPSAMKMCRAMMPVWRRSGGSLAPHIFIAEG